MMQDAVLRTTLGLIMVVAVILAMAWMARRTGLVSRQGGSAGLKLVSRLSLGPRQNVIVVQAQDTWLVLGQTATNITVLHTMPAQAAPEAPGPDSRSDFPQALAAKLGKALKRP
ncbi:flagellar biosynthetic protein FliO [Bordetella sp. FB-8]|uniref:flagellar biosynthetic protein FliO n=1 Tax=Bordetella sp. FB-8 TaxID=1159870 RepID=UPI0003629CFF|nr:flagellar biosynthetic protein FliO [Bordetella sp. FB-8]